nr:type IV pilus modification protein PilV [Guyparkeria hydrothermalis]
MPAQAGVGLIEVLVAVLVLSIGFFGMAKLQSQALASANSAAAHQMGTVASYSMFDSMRIDTEGVARGDYDSVSITVPEDPADCASGGIGHGGALAVRHQQEWCAQLGLLAGPSTTGEIERLSGDQYRIIITFAEHAMADVESRVLSTRARL